MSDARLKRILVTGGAGFIGSHTVDLLLQQGKQVIVLDNLSTGKVANLDLHHPLLEFIEGDILEYPLLEDLLANCDAVLHLAAIASVARSIEEPIYTFQVNTQGLLHVLQALHQTKQKTQRSIRLVYASSAAVYGNVKALPCRDDEPLSMPPLSPYALQKMNCEQYANLYARLFGVSSLGLRYFNVYGLRQDPASFYSGVISKFLITYQNNDPLKIFGEGKQSRDFIYVRDVAHANVLALDSSVDGVLNIATGQAKTLLELVKDLEMNGGKSAQIQFEPARLGDIQSSYGETKNAENQLKFRAATSLNEGIKEMMQG